MHVSSPKDLPTYEEPWASLGITANSLPDAMRTLAIRLQPSPSTAALSQGATAIDELQAENVRLTGELTSLRDARESEIVACEEHQIAAEAQLAAAREALAGELERVQTVGRQLNHARDERDAAREETQEWAEAARRALSGCLQGARTMTLCRSLGSIELLATTPPNGVSALKRAAKLEAALKAVKRCCGLGLDGGTTCTECIAIVDAALAETAPEEGS